MKLTQLNSKYDSKLKEQEKILLSNYQEKTEKYKEANQKNLEILNSQKDDLEAQLANQLKRIDEQHSREVDELNNQNYEKIQKAKTTLAADFAAQVRSIEQANDEELDKRRDMLKSHSDLMISTLEEKITIGKVKLETEQNALDAKIEALKAEEARFEAKEKELRQKMQNLEAEFEEQTRLNQKTMHERIVELAEKKEALEKQVDERKVTNENFKRDNERLRIENNEWLLKIEKIKEDYLRRVHEQDLSEIRQTSEHIRELRQTHAQKQPTQQLKLREFRGEMLPTQRKGFNFCVKTKQTAFYKEQRQGKEEHNTKSRTHFFHFSVNFSSSSSTFSINSSNGA